MGSSSAPFLYKRGPRGLASSQNSPPSFHTSRRALAALPLFTLTFCPSAESSMEMAIPAEDDDSSFSPSNDRLVDRYLRAKLDGRISDLGAKAAYFRDADVCSARPEELVRNHGMPARVQSRDAGDGKQWYFFSPVRLLGTSLKKKSRTITGTGDKESWHAEGRPKPIEGSAGGGYVTKFSYHVRIGPNNVEKPGWIMAEYSFKDARDGDTVPCRIYKSPRALEDLGVPKRIRQAERGRRRTTSRRRCPAGDRAASARPRKTSTMTTL